jgi:hypothetical protein
VHVNAGIENRKCRQESMPDHEEDWVKYKKRKNQALFALFGYIPVCFAVNLLTVRLFHTDKPARFLAYFRMVMFIVVGHRLIVLPCPRCGRTVLTHPLRSCARSFKK